MTSTSTISGYFPSTTDQIEFQVKNVATGQFMACADTQPVASNPLTDCARNNSAQWYPFSMPATLPSLNNHTTAPVPCTTGCCVDDPWNYFQANGGGNNTILTQIVDRTNDVGPLATFSHYVPDPAGGGLIPVQQCVQEFTCSDDVINHCSQSAMGLPQTLQLKVPCGKTGQQCCLPLPSTFPPGTPGTNASCTDTGTSCDWDLICRYHLWPPAGTLGHQASSTWYAQNWTVPGGNMQHNWTDEAQGVASDGVYWYFSAGDWSARILPNIYRIGFNDSWDQDMPIAFAGFYQAPTPDGIHGICGHWGDIDVDPWGVPGHGATVYIPEEECQDERTRLLIMEDPQDGRPMTFAREFLLNYGPSGKNQALAPAVAINHSTQEIYLTGEDPASYVHIYKWIGNALVWQRDLPLLDANGKLMSLQDPNTGGTTSYVQGLAFSPEGGKLYIQTQMDLVHPLLGFQVTPTYLSMTYSFGMSWTGDSGSCPQETEGITVVNTDVSGGPNLGQIHGLVYEDHGFACTGSGGVWAKHIRLNNSDARF